MVDVDPSAHAGRLSLAAAVRQTLDRLDVGVVVQAGDGAIVDANPAAARLLGLTMDQLLGRDSFDPRWRAVGEDGEVMPGDRHPAMVALAQEREVLDALLGVEVPGRGLRWLSVSAYPIRERADDPASSVAGVTAVFRDVSDLARADAALRTWERRYRLAAELAPVGVGIFSADGRVIRANRAFERLFQRSEQQMQAGPWWRVLPVRESGSFRPLATALMSGERESVSAELELTTDPPRFVRVDVGALATPDSAPEAVAVVEDITEEVERRTQLERRADHDALTGLLHLRSLLERAPGRDWNTAMAAVFVDIDHFKDINDTFGHAAGDTVLTDLAERLAAQVRSDDLAARAGGDEFVLLLRSVPRPSVAEAIAGRMVTAARVPVLTPVGAVSATVSVGLAVAEPGTPVGELLRRADRAMYAAKAAGRDRVVVDHDGS